MILEAVFLKLIRQEPGNELHRLVYADWLEEQGNPKAEQVRAWNAARPHQNLNHLIGLFPQIHGATYSWRAGGNSCIHALKGNPHSYLNFNLPKEMTVLCGVEIFWCVFGDYVLSLPLPRRSYIVNELIRVQNSKPYEYQFPNCLFTNFTGILSYVCYYLNHIKLNDSTYITMLDLRKHDDNLTSLRSIPNLLKKFHLIAIAYILFGFYPNLYSFDFYVKVERMGL